MNWITLVFGFVFGTIIGSFLNVCIHRIPQGKSIITPSSHCPLCKKPIRFFDNIPLVSFLWLRGRCRTCNAPISLRYPLVELLMGLFSVILLWRFGISAFYFIYFALFASLTLISFIDLTHRIIPDVISLPGIIIGLVISLLHPQMSISNSLIGVLVGGGSLYVVANIYQLVTKREGMGGGDVKLLAMIGAFIGWKGVLFTILCSSFIGSVVGVAMMFISKADSKYAVPFGPFLSFGAMIFVLFGDPLISWYFGLFQRGAA
jgi:leader peptidase (prepilin peptidase)/N-methyltransferase